MDSSDGKYVSMKNNDKKQQVKTSDNCITIIIKPSYNPRCHSCLITDRLLNINSDINLNYNEFVKL